MNNNTSNLTFCVYLGKLYQQELFATSAVKKHYFFGGKLVAMREGGGVRFLLTDHASALLSTGLGSVNVVLDTNGNVDSQLRYDPWGKQRYALDVTPTGYRYTSQRWDSGLGLYDYNARYYDPHIGRFISADTLVPDPAAPQAFNRYAYGLGNPLVFVDPSGHCTQYAGVNDAELSACLEAWNALGNSYLELWQLGGMGSYPDEWMNWLLQNGTTGQIQALLDTMHTSVSTFRKHKWNDMHTGCSPTWGGGQKCAPDGGWPKYYPMSDEEKAELIAKGIKLGVTFPLNFMLGKGVKWAVSKIIDDPIYAFAASLIIRGVVVNRTTSKIYDDIVEYSSQPLSPDLNQTSHQYSIENTTWLPQQWKPDLERDEN